MNALIFLLILVLHMGHRMRWAEQPLQVERWPHGANSMEAGALRHTLHTLSLRSRSSSWNALSTAPLMVLSSTQPPAALEY